MQNRITWRNLTAVFVALVGITFLAGRIGVYNKGVIGIVTAQFYSAFSETASADGEITHDGTSFAFSTDVSFTSGITLPSGKDISFAVDDTSDIGTDAKAAQKIFANDLDLADDLVVDDDALVSGTLTVTEGIVANGGLELANTKDITVATDQGSDLGTEAKSVGAIYGTTLDIDSTSAIGGVMSFSAAPDFASNVPTMATSRTAFIWAYELNITDGFTTGAAEVMNTKATIALADTAADEHIYLVWTLPDDFDIGDSDAYVSLIWLCDNATVSEGEFDLTYLAIAPDDADAALGNELTVLDTAVQNQWMQTGDMVIPRTAFAAGDVALALDIYHDVADPLCNTQDVNILGVKIGYTTDSNY